MIKACMIVIIIDKQIKKLCVLKSYNIMVWRVCIIIIIILCW